ncbi:MAG: TSCPD domain-containing protein [Candidatus Nanoarchaeia archaeon]|nr:TSCPD domain-containing protein [Candidatus Nanoarchaeia archaeon]
MADVEKKEEKKQKKTRPVKLCSTTHRVRVSCGHLYITVSLHNEDNKPFEIFIAGSKLRGCRANQESVARLVSILLRNDLMDEAIDQLNGIICHACVMEKTKLPPEEKKNIANSCGDAVAKILQEYYVEKPKSDGDKK